MSELKAYTIYEGDVGNYTEHVVYSKSEADEVIADLEESHKMEVEQLLIEIAEHKNKLQNVSSLLKETREWLIESQKLHKRCADNAVKVIRLQKYKRCLDKVEMCKAMYDKEDAKVNDGLSWEYISPEMKYWERWRWRWEDIAEKFKEAK